MLKDLFFPHAKKTFPVMSEVFFYCQKMVDCTLRAILG